MDGTVAGEVTRLLRAADDGDANAVPRLIPLVYDQLRSLADAQLRRESPGHTLTPTALVHEAYMKLRSVLGSHGGGDGQPRAGPGPGPALPREQPSPTLAPFEPRPPSAGPEAIP